MDLSCLFRWIIRGPNTKLSHEDKCSVVQKGAMHLVQSTVAMCFTDRQVKNKKFKAIYFSREIPQQLAVSIAIHLAIRIKEILNLLHGFRMAIEYNRLLRVESEIEKTVIKRKQIPTSRYRKGKIRNRQHCFFRRHL